MRYFIGVFIPLLIQCLLIFLIIEMNTGNGSWVGLGAFLLGIFAIPATALVNFTYIKKCPNLNNLSILIRSFLIAFITTFLVVLMMTLG